MPIPLRVLLLEDRATDAELVIESLREHDYEPDWVRVDTEADFRAQLDEPWDLILADYSLPQFSGPAALQIVNDRQLAIPVIIVSGTVGEDTAVAVLQLGASDYLLKDRLARLGAAVDRALEQRRLREEQRRSERRFQALIEHSPDGIALMDASGHTIYAGPSTQRILGYRAEELFGRTPAEVFHPDDWPMLQAAFQDLVTRPNHTLKIEYRFRHRNGAWRWLEGTVTNLLHEPSVAAMVLNYRDITERKQAEAQIARLATVTDQAAETIVVTDLDGNIVYVNPFFTSLTGFTPAEVLGQNPRILKSGEHDRAFYQQLWNTINRGEIWKGELINRRKDDRLYHEEAAIFPITDQTGRIINYAAVKHDITERKQHEREVEALATVSAALRSALSRAEILPSVLEHVSQLLNVDGILIMLRDPATGEVVLEAGHGTVATFVGQRIPPGAGMVGRVLATGHPYLTNEAQHDALLYWPEMAAGLTTVVCVPVISGTEPMGAVWVGCRAPIPESEVRLLNAIADIMSSALQRAALFEAEHRQRTLAEALRDSAAALNSTLNFDEMLDRIMSAAWRVVPHDTINVMLLDESGQVARVARQHGYGRYSARDFMFEVAFVIEQTPNLKTMAASGQPLIVPDTQLYAGWIALPQLAWLRSYAGVPIQIRGQLVGFLNLDSATPGFFVAAHAEQLQALADQVAVAFENTRLYEATRRHAEELEARVTDRTRALSAANLRLQELDQLKSKFVSDVSHELRTPVTSLGLYAELLEHGKPDRREKYIAQIQTQAARLAQLVNDILNLSRLEMGAEPPSFEAVDLNDLTTSVVETYQASAEEAGLDLTFTPDRALPPVSGERNQLAQVITNLVANAINYTPRGTVRVATERLDSTGVCLTVQDSGLGIDAGDIPRLFDRFYRGKQAVTSMIRGTGLGLAIVKEIVDLHRGTIEVESTLGQGTTFRVCLPSELPPADRTAP